MKHPNLHDVDLALDPVAEIVDRPLTRAEKIERWAQLLEAWPKRVRAFDSIELTPRAYRAPLRADGSALSVAFADPVLRADGLKGDSYAEGRAYFDLSHGDMHRLLCRCHIGATEASTRTAARLRRLHESPFAPVARLAQRVGQAITGRFA
jgi:hypothetical protein